MINTNELKAARVRRGLSQGRMASALGIRQNRYNPMENGKLEIPLPLVGKIIRVLDLSRHDVDTIFKLNDIYSNCKSESMGVHDNTQQLQFNGCVMVCAMYSCCFWVEIRLFCCRSVDEKPADSVCDCSLSETVCAIDIGVLAVKVYGKLLDASEIFEFKAQNFHIVPPLVLEISKRFVYNTFRLNSRRSSEGINFQGARLALAINALGKPLSFCQKTITSFSPPLSTILW